MGLPMERKHIRIEPWALIIGAVIFFSGFCVGLIQGPDLIVIDPQGTFFDSIVEQEESAIIPISLGGLPLILETKTTGYKPDLFWKSLFEILRANRSDWN